MQWRCLFMTVSLLFELLSQEVLFLDPQIGAFSVNFSPKKEVGSVRNRCLAPVSGFQTAHT